jgi:hypothetical protein
MGANNAEKRDGEARPSVNEPHTDALVRSIAARLIPLGRDVIEAFDDLLVRVERGAEQYGVLDLANNPRDWDREAYEEWCDLQWYQAFARLASKNRALAKLRVEAALELQGASTDLDPDGETPSDGILR